MLQFSCIYSILMCWSWWQISTVSKQHVATRDWLFFSGSYKRVNYIYAACSSIITLLFTSRESGYTDFQRARSLNTSRDSALIKHKVCAFLSRCFFRIFKASSKDKRTLFIPRETVVQQLQYKVWKYKRVQHVSCIIWLLIILPVTIQGKSLLSSFRE